MSHTFFKRGQKIFQPGPCPPSYEPDSGVASPKICEGPKTFGGAKMCDFRRITLFCLENRLSKHKMTIFSKNLGGMAPLAPLGYDYGA